MKRFMCLIAVATLAIAGCETDTEITTVQQETPQPPAVALPDIRQTRVYDVTIENLTRGQPLSPGVVLTHTSQVTVWTVGQPADSGVANIAEAGNEAPAAAMLDGRAGVGNLMRIETPTPPMGAPKPNMTKVRITAPPNVDRLSVVTMLTCTNDGFTGANGVALPMDFNPASFTERAYDAGAEVNNEQSPFIVPGCSAFGPVDLPLDGNMKAPEDGVIREHPGIQGTGDLPEIARWTAPVVRVTIQRVPIQ